MSIIKKNILGAITSTHLLAKKEIIGVRRKLHRGEDARLESGRESYWPDSAKRMFIFEGEHWISGGSVDVGETLLSIDPLRKSKGVSDLVHLEDAAKGY